MCASVFGLRALFGTSPAASTAASHSLSVSLRLQIAAASRASTSAPLPCPSMNRLGSAVKVAALVAPSGYPWRLHGTARKPAVQCVRFSIAILLSPCRYRHVDIAGSAESSARGSANLPRNAASRSFSGMVQMHSNLLIDEGLNAIRRASSILAILHFMCPARAVFDAWCHFYRPCPSRRLSLYTSRLARMALAANPLFPRSKLARSGRNWSVNLDISRLPSPVPFLSSGNNHFGQCWLSEPQVLVLVSGVGRGESVRRGS